MTYPKTVINAPVGSPSSRRLIDVIRPLPEFIESGVPGRSTAAVAERWGLGVKWQPRPCTGLTAVAAAMCDVEELTAISQECYEAIEQTPFQIIDSMKASTLEYTVDEIAAMVATRFDLMLSATLASELVSSAASTGRGLATVATAPTDVAFGSAATNINKAVAALEDQLARDIPGQAGMIHMAPGLFTNAVGECHLEKIDGQWYTPNGHLVVADAGYVDAIAPTGQAAASAFEGWVYSSGPVYGAWTPAIPLGVNQEAMNVRRNYIYQWLQSYAILVFDPCPVSAVLANYTAV